MPRFLVDAQLPPTLAKKLTALGHKVIHVLNVDLLEARDSKRQDLVPGFLPYRHGHDYIGAK